MLKILILFLITLSAQAEILDKVAGVINDKVITLSEIKRIKSTANFRNKVAPLIYKEESYSVETVLSILQQMYIVRDKLAELGYVISDDSVESRISETEKIRNLKRQDLINFLESNGITFSEYFELIRQGMEYSIFYSRIISPLVNITDQEIKNSYYKSQAGNKALSFIYELTDFTFNRILVSKEIVDAPIHLDEYLKTGNIPSDFSDFSTNNLGKIKHDDLPKDLSKLLKNTNEGSFSEPYVKDGITHIFYIGKKDIAESNDFLNKREQIYNQLFMLRSNSIVSNWFSRESLNYYILNNL